jgi:hypothetical protein
VDVLVNRGGPKNKRRKIQGRIWVYIALGGRVVFDFSLSRSRDGPVSFLKGFRGYLQGDKYSGYDYLALKDGITKVGCWAHVRRKYVEALDADRKRSAFMIWLIGWLYRIESMLKARRARDPSYDDERTLAARKRLAHHVLDKIHATLKGYEKDPDVLPKSPLGQAVSYTLNQWDDLKVYPDDLELVPDNNASERALRAVAIGRKNYLFMGSPQGGKTAAVLYSLIGTCKALHLNPYPYLLDVTERLVRDRSTPPVELTPWAWRDARKQQGDAILDEVAAEAMSGVEERETVAAGAGD